MARVVTGWLSVVCLQSQMARGLNKKVCLQYNSAQHRVAHLADVCQYIIWSGFGFGFGTYVPHQASHKNYANYVK